MLFPVKIGGLFPLQTNWGNFHRQSLWAGGVALEPLAVDRAIEIGMIDI